MKIIALDTETTGLEEGTKSIVELGMIIMEYEGDAFTVITGPTIWDMRFKPRGPISFGAMGVHHITEDDVAGCDDISKEANVIAMHLDHADYILGHNLKFDMEVIEREILGGPYDPQKQIDTLRAAKHAWDDLTEYNLAALRYRFNLPTLDTGSQHSAAFDAFLTLQLALHATRVMEIDSWQDLYSKSISPLFLKLMPFGKHRTEPIVDVLEQDKGYFQWLRRQPWFQGEWPDLAYTLKKLGGK